MITISLSHLSISDQLQVLYHEGVYLSKRKLESETVILYQFHQVYVEIFYLEYRKRVERIIYSSAPEVLDPYLENISVDFLLNPL